MTHTQHSHSRAMLLHKIQRGTKTNYLTIPRILATYYGWRVGSYVYIQQLSPTELRLTLIGATPTEAAENLSRLIRPHQSPGATAPRDDRQPSDPGPRGQHGEGGPPPTDPPPS